MIFKVFGFLYSIRRPGSTIASYNIIQYTAQYVIVQRKPQPWCVLVCGLSCPALTSSNSRVLPEEHCRRRRSLSSDKSAAAAVTSAHSYDDMHSGGPPLHYTVLPPAGMLAQLSPLAVLNNNGFTRKLQVQATLLQAAAVAATAVAAAGATGAEDQIPKKSTSLFVWHCNIRAKVQLISECPLEVLDFPKIPRKI